jgi:hypothetical protein
LPVAGSTAAGLLLTVAASFVPQRAAHAQTETLMPIRIKAGLFEPSSGGPDYGGEVDVVQAGSGGAMGLLSAGYFTADHGGRTFRDIPIGLSKVTGLANPASGVTGNIYVGGGFGVYFLQASGGGEASQSETRYGAFFQAGYQTPFSLFIEAKYHLVSGGVDGFSANGLNVFVGVKL